MTRAPKPASPKHTVVSSSHIESIGYDAPTRQLHVKFSNGNTHMYGGVTPEQHQDLMLADSKGGHFQKHIRPHHEGVKLTEGK